MTKRFLFLVLTLITTICGVVHGQNPVSVRGVAKGATPAGTVTSTAQGADHQAFDTAVYFAGTIVDPRAIRVLTSGDIVTVVQPTGTNLHVVCDSGCTPGGSFTDNSAFTFGTTAINNAGYVVDDVATNAVAENSAGAPRMSGNRIAYVDLSKTTANATAITVTGAATTLPAVTDPGVHVRVIPQFTNADALWTSSDTLNALADTTILSLDGMHGAGIQITASTLVGTVEFEATTGVGGLWSPIYGRVSSTGRWVQSVTDPATGNVSFAPWAGARQIRLRISAYTSGSATVVPVASSLISPITPIMFSEGVPTEAISLFNLVGGIDVGSGDARILRMHTSPPSSGAYGLATREVNAVYTAASTPAVAADRAQVVAISPNNSVAITAGALPLPAGAATSALQTTGNTSLNSIDTKTLAAGQALMAASSPVVIASNQSAVPISAAALPLPAGAATAALQTQPGVDIGDVTINNAAGAAAVNVQDGGNSLTVDGATATAPALSAAGLVTRPVPRNLVVTGALLNVADTLVITLDGRPYVHAAVLADSSLAAGQVFFEVSYDGGVTYQGAVGQGLSYPQNNTDPTPAISHNFATLNNTDFFNYAFNVGPSATHFQLRVVTTALTSSKTFVLGASENMLGIGTPQVKQGPKGSTTSAWWTAIVNGAGTQVAVTAASTAAVASDPGLVVSLSPNSIGPVNLSQVAGTSLSVNNGVVGAGVPRVTLASDSTGNIATIGTSVTPGTAATNLGKAEDAAHTSGDVGVSDLWVRRDTNAQTTSADAEYATPAVDAYSTVFTRLDHNNRINCTINSTAVVSTLITGCGAPGAGLSIYITTISFYNSIAGALANPFTLQSGTGGTCAVATTIVWRAWNPAALGGINYALNTPIKLTANHELCFLQVGAGTRLVNIQGFIAP